MSHDEVSTSLSGAKPWDLAPELPWQFIGSPLQHWQDHPAFLIGEYLFMVCATIALWHASRCGRDHLLIWFGALIAGTANDLIFMALPLVDNFWQAQASIMLTPRLPLYIPCVYVCFMYYPTVAVRRLGLPRLAQAAASGLAAYVFYFPYDAVGAKFLWWSWHDTDLPIAKRILGAPASSGLWTLCFVGAFAWLIDRALTRDADPRGLSFARGIASVAAFCTVIMMLQITVLQQLDGGAPGYIALGVGVAIYLAIVAKSWRAATGVEPQPADTVLRNTVWVYFGALLTIALLCDPAAQRSAGIHQTPGECYVEAKDITGLTRHQFLCVDDFDEPYDFSCAMVPEAGSQWFTLCGKPHKDETQHMRFAGGVGAFGLFGAWLFGFAFGRRRDDARVD